MNNRLAYNLPSPHIAFILVKRVLVGSWRGKLGRLGAASLFVLWGALLAQADETGESSRQLTRIAAGTTIDPAIEVDDIKSRWNRIVLLAKPRIASGDVNSLSASVRESVSEFVLTIMAAVERVADPASGELRFRLVDVGLAYSVEQEGRLMTVSADTAEQHAVKLGFLSRMLLAENEQQLKTAQITVRTSTLMIFDVPSLMLRKQEHQPYLMRHFVWIDPRTGRSSALVWLIQQSAAGPDAVEQLEPARYLPTGFREDRAIHVDGSQFNLLGIPSKTAFALENLPAGKPLAWTPDALELAARRSFDVDALRQLSAELNRMLQSARGSPAESAAPKEN